MKNYIPKTILFVLSLFLVQGLYSTISAQAVVMHDERGYFTICNGELFITNDTHVTINANGGGLLAITFTDIDTSCEGGNTKRGTAVKDYPPVPLNWEGTTYYTEPGHVTLTPNGKLIYRARFAPGTFPVNE